MTRQEREVARALLSAESRRKWLYVEAADDGDSCRVSLAAPVSDASPVVRSPTDLALRALDTIDVLEAENLRLRDLLRSTLPHTACIERPHTMPPPWMPVELRERIEAALEGERVS